MTRKKAPPVPKPRKAILCQADDDPEVTHRNFAQTITAPEVSAFRIVAACEQPALKEQLDTPALIRLLKDRGEASTMATCRTPNRCSRPRQRRCKRCSHA